MKKLYALVPADTPLSRVKDEALGVVAHLRDLKLLSSDWQPLMHAEVAAKHDAHLPDVLVTYEGAYIIKRSAILMKLRLWGCRRRVYVFNIQE